MSNLVLPGIEPARVVPSAAGAIDQAGAQFKAAADDVSGFMYQMEQADIEVQTQEAALEVQKGLNDTIDQIKSQPYATPDDVKAMFGGEAPPTIRLEENGFDAAGAPVVKKRDLIPMHEVARDLFERRAKQVMDSASVGIKHEGWRARFQRAAAADVERARSEAYDWQRAQRLADIEVRSVSNFHQAVNARMWNTAESILLGTGMRPEVREKLAADFPRVRTEAELQDRIRSAQTPEDLDKVSADIKVNRTGEGGFFAPLSADDQDKYTAVARERKRQMLAEQEAARKAAKEAVHQEVGGYVERAVLQARVTGQAPDFRAANEAIARSLGSLDVQDTMALVNYMKASADPNRPNDMWVFSQAAEMQRAGKLKGLPISEVYKFKPSLDDSHYGQVLGWWMKANDKEGSGGADKPLFNAEQERAITDVLLGPMKLDAPTEGPKARTEFLIRRAMLEQGLLEWKQNHPDEPMLGNTVMTVAAQIFPKGMEIDKDSAGARAALQMSLPSTLGHVPTQPEIDEALRGIEEQRSFVDQAFDAIVDSDEVKLDTSVRGRIYGMLKNASTRQQLTDRILERNPKAPINDITLTREAMSVLYPQTTQSRAYQAGQEAKATREETVREVEAAGQVQADARAEVEAVDAAAAKAAQEAKDAAARAARKAAWAKVDAEAKAREEQRRKGKK